ncbi:MAG: hypothetical protein QXS41_01145 [Candidatus Woesearchaeota archaeon]
MILLITGLFFLITAIVATKIAIETPEEMHLRKKIMYILITINIITTILFIFLIRKIEIIFAAFFYFIISQYQLLNLFNSFINHRRDSFHKFFFFSNYLLIYIALSYYILIYYYDFFFLFSILGIIMNFLINILNTYLEIYEALPHTKFTTETKFEKSLTKKWYLNCIKNNFSIIVAYILLEILLRL